MEKFVYFNNLFAIYKDLLTPKNQIIFSFYYEDNLSLQEIADNLQVSKSYVGNVLKKSENKLQTLENKLHIYEKNEVLRKLLEVSDLEQIKKKLQQLII